MSVTSLTLTSGRELPAVGLGTWKIAKDVATDVIQQATKVGYRHFDCACDYGNERQVGNGLNHAMEAGLVQRDDLWITSKLWNTYHRTEHVQPALQHTLDDLRLDYLDLYLVHFPIALRFVPFEERYPPEWFFEPESDHPCMHPAAVSLHETWQAMEELVRSGLVREIGVCNVGCAMLRDLLSYAEIAPAVLQVELHPYLTQDKLLRFCRESDVVVTAFSPLGAQSYFSIGMADPIESVLKQSVIQEIAARHERTPAQIVLRWGIQRQTAVVPKTTHPEHLRENLTLFDFELAQEEMNAVTSLNQNRRFNDPGEFCEAAFNTFFPIFD